MINEQGEIIGLKVPKYGDKMGEKTNQDLLKLESNDYHFCLAVNKCDFKVVFQIRKMFKLQHCQHQTIRTLT